MDEGKETNRRDFLSLDHAAEEQRTVGDVGGTGPLLGGGMTVERVLEGLTRQEDGEDTYEAVVVAVDHDGAALPHVDELLPPVGHVVRAQPTLQDQVALETTAHSLAEPLRQELQFRVFLRAQDGLHREEMLADGLVKGGQRQMGEGPLERVHHRVEFGDKMENSLEIGI